MIHEPPPKLPLCAIEHY